MCESNFALQSYTTKCIWFTVFHFLSISLFEVNQFNCHAWTYCHMHDRVLSWILYQGCSLCQLNTDGHTNVTARRVTSLSAALKVSTTAEEGHVSQNTQAHISEVTKETQSYPYSPSLALSFLEPLTDSTQCRSKITEAFPHLSVRASACATLSETKTPAVGSPVGKACGRKMWARRRVIMSAGKIWRVILHKHTSKKTVGGERRRQHVICLLWYKIASREGLEGFENARFCVFVSSLILCLSCLWAEGGIGFYESFQNVSR